MHYYIERFFMITVSLIILEVLKVGMPMIQKAFYVS